MRKTIREYNVEIQKYRSSEEFTLDDGNKEVEAKDVTLDDGNKEV